MKREQQQANADEFCALDHFHTMISAGDAALRQRNASDECPLEV